MVASSRNIELKSLKEREALMKPPSKLNSQLQKKLLGFSQQLIMALIKPLLKVLRLEERKIPLKRQKIMLTVFIAWIYSQL
jgi:hypothetical protein